MYVSVKSDVTFFLGKSFNATIVNLLDNVTAKLKAIVLCFYSRNQMTLL